MTHDKRCRRAPRPGDQRQREREGKCCMKVMYSAATDREDDNGMFKAAFHSTNLNPDPAIETLIFHSI